MRTFLAALTLAATVFVAVTGVFASDNVDPSYYTDRVATGGSNPVSVSNIAARSAGEIYLEQHNENMTQ